MICVLALIVSAILGIFSATHRKIAVEAFDCVFRKVTLRKCNTRLDKRLKADLSGRIIKKSPAVGKWVYTHFEILSWILLIITVLSLAGLAWGGYNYYLYGNCNGPNSEGFCVFDPTGQYQGHSEVAAAECTVPELQEAMLTTEQVNFSLLPKLTSGNHNTVLFLGCYACEYTRNAYDDIMKLADEPGVDFYFGHFPVKEHNSLLGNILTCMPEDSVRAYNDAVFSTPVEELDEKGIRSLLRKLNMDEEAFIACAQNNSTQARTRARVDMLTRTHIYGTPLVFINNETFVGPKPYRTYKRALR